MTKVLRTWLPAVPLVAVAMTASAQTPETVLHLTNKSDPAGAAAAESQGGGRATPGSDHTISIIQPPGPVFYVAPGGVDTTTRSGSLSEPWASISFAIGQVSDGSTILVRPGIYHGRVNLQGHFSAQGILVKSELPYMARLSRNSDQVVTFFNAVGITLEGFDISHDGTQGGPLVVQVSGFGSGQTHDVALINNIIHDSNNNDLLKINDSSFNVLVKNNLFYNQEGSDEHIDVNSVANITIEDNIFSSDFSMSGLSGRIGTVGSHITIKDSSGGGADLFEGSRDVVVRRNIFVNYQGGTGTNFILVGEDGQSFFEAFDVLIENNLLLGNSTTRMRAPFGIKGARDVIVRHNTVVGDQPALEHGLRINKEGQNQPAEDISFFNNIWSDPAGTMDEPFAAAIDATHLDISTFELDNNLYWNNGNAIPVDPNMLVNFDDDANRIVAAPLLGNPAGLIVPYWNGSTFADGSPSIREVFENLVEQWGTPLPASPVRAAARADQTPLDDILGRLRGAADVGAVAMAAGTEGEFIGVLAPGVSELLWLIDVSGDGSFNADEDAEVSFGTAGIDSPIVGDWNGDGRDEVGAVRLKGSQIEWRLDASRDWQFSPPDPTYLFGDIRLDTPIAGDWDGDGVDEIGVVRLNGDSLEWRLDADGNGMFAQPGDTLYLFGSQDLDLPVTGDWNGDGRDEAGTVRPNGGQLEWRLDFDGDGQFGLPGDAVYSFGEMGLDLPVVGDWDGNGTDEIGTVRLTNDRLEWRLDLSGDGQWVPANDLAYTSNRTDAPVAGMF